MKIEVRVFSGLEKYIPGTTFGKAFEVELPEGATGSMLLEKLSIPEKDVFTILSNGKHFQFAETFSEGDRVALFPPVGGG